ncbi:MAG: hypothetical protein H6700_02910 [Myxococcales bacterium]|nr:hypothetical protein [Myxococcales bacterium]MCB9530691.1 hypothetical protein [Myxococcales bacterium]
MRKLALPILAVTLGACSADLAPSDDSATVVTGQSVTVTADDGTEFEVSIEHDGSLTPADEAAIIGRIDVIAVPVAPSAESPFGVAGGTYVPPVDPRLVPTDAVPARIWVTGDADVIVGNYRWDWIDNLDEADIEASIELLCPPWH